MRGEYNTRQKREMLTFLKNHDLEHYTVDELVFQMEQNGEKIGRTTAYRYLELLSEQGNVRKYQNSQGITMYQHIESSEDCDTHFHMMCKKCGRLFHVGCGLMETMSRHILADHNFMLDPRETILVGICGKCGGMEGMEKDGADHCKECHCGL